MKTDSQTMKLSKDFSLLEFTRSQTASRKGIENDPPEESIPAIQLLVESVLQPARSHFAKPMNINSGYRSPELNTAIGGSKTSQHMWTSAHAAADVEVFGVDNLTLARWIEANCPFDQLICECYDPAQGPNSGWVHASIRTDGRNRKESLTYQRGEGYSPGLPS
jgi:zinc D-Ala-D-Ala carboxypeptidase